MINRQYRKTTVFVLFAFLWHLTLPVFQLAEAGTIESEKGSSWFAKIPKRITRNFSVGDTKNMSPDEVQALIDDSEVETFQGNPALRAEQETILTPIKRVALGVLDGQIGIVRQFFGFKATELAKKGFTGDSPLIKARDVVSSMSDKQIEGVSKTLSRAGITEAVKAQLPKSSGMQNFVKGEAGFLLMNVVGTMIAMGVYDGLDVSGMKDRVIQLDSLKEHGTVAENFLPGYLGGVVKRQFSSFFNNQFENFFESAISSKGFGGNILRSLDGRIDEVGKQIFKATRLGIAPTETAGPSLAEKLGLVGVGGGAQLSLKGLLKSISTGLAFGLVANLVTDTVVTGVRGRPGSSLIGGNRNEVGMQADYNSNRFQKSNSEIKNWVNERKFALLDLYDGYKKSPVTKVMGAVAGFAGGYIGSVVAGAILVGGGLPAMIGGVMISSVFGGIGSFLGSWATTKFERGEGMKEFRREQVENRLFNALLKMEVYTAGRIDQPELRKLAEERSRDMYKLEGLGRPYNRLFLVEDFDRVELYQAGEYVYMRVDERYGESFNHEAHVRYALIDLDGDEGTWDILTNRIYNLGNIQRNSGFGVHYVTDDSSFFVRNDLLDSDSSESGFRVLSNGVVMTKDDFEPDKWVVRGLNVNTDVFLRNRKQRFSWDWDLNAYKAVGAISTSGLSLEPVKTFLESESEFTFRDGLNRLLEEMALKNKAAAISIVEAVDQANEAEFFMKLEDTGFSPRIVRGFISMEITEWKNIISGRVERGFEGRLQAAISVLETKTRVELLDELQKLDSSADENAENVWMAVKALMDPVSLVAAVVTE